jgi:hypothetical protein
MRQCATSNDRSTAPARSLTIEATQALKRGTRKPILKKLLPFASGWRRRSLSLQRTGHAFATTALLYQLKAKAFQLIVLYRQKAPQW